MGQARGAGRLAVIIACCVPALFYGATGVSFLVAYWCCRADGGTSVTVSNIAGTAFLLGLLSIPGTVAGAVFLLYSWRRLTSGQQKVALILLGLAALATGHASMVLFTVGDV